MEHAARDATAGGLNRPYAVPVILTLDVTDATEAAARRQLDLQ
jgi:hypothetical protein